MHLTNAGEGYSKSTVASIPTVVEEAIVRLFGAASQATKSSPGTVVLSVIHPVVA